MMSKLWAKLRHACSARDRAEPDRVRCQDKCLEVVRDGRRLYAVMWAEIRQIFAYKDDVFFFDVICIGLRLDDSGRWCWIDEQMYGYAEAVAELERRFPGWPEDWWHSVAMPPFARCFTHLWGQEFDWDLGRVIGSD